MIANKDCQLEVLDGFFLIVLLVDVQLINPANWMQQALLGKFVPLHGVKNVV